ncbi:MAG TPA: polyprenyl synthetase family protein [Acidimicrobiales bacterium]|nr:polyprenyl synthetase family protein [Acidimicrobiales bacterium]
MTAVSPIAWRADPEADLARVEKLLLSSTVNPDRVLSEISAHLVRAGGKRLRPAFALCTSMIDSPGPLSDDALRPAAVQAAVSVELVHLGSLYHDDVIDGAETRRGVETVNHRWGVLEAILAGDFLMARASELAAGLGTAMAELLASTIGWLCEGQVRELATLHDPGRSETEYLEAIASKTGALFATSCRMGGMAGGMSLEDLELVTEYGRLYGLAFQIVDDVLDLVATESELGKKTGTDLREGVFTLPVIRALESGGELRDLLSTDFDSGGAARARELILAGDGIDYAVDVAQAHIDAARRVIEPLPAGPAVEGLRTAAKELISTLPLTPA